MQLNDSMSGATEMALDPPFLWDELREKFFHAHALQY